MTVPIKPDVNQLIQQAHNRMIRLARQEIIRIATDILRRCKRPHVFTMSMGGYDFLDKDGDELIQECYHTELGEFIKKWDNLCWITMTPLKIDKKGWILDY